MRIGQVVGRVVLNQCMPEFRGARWLLVSPMNRRDLENSRDGGLHLTSTPSPVVYDEIGAGLGDIIGFSEGGEASAPFEQPMPLDAYNCCILDKITICPS